ncbi:V-type ATP synthase subunit F [Acetanaerobacterium elongatum]|uniref:V/A-type H+-transporting ATPase subunit F n=1 Tax=Acetanaerobacterium elongatum TaxID=258515 RepID=A0A1G9ULZ3_9FIRM|nr:V-type ATP synthase subunit F [Acetanaerobacterium elongatum]SDM60960.1 V/A-type H+-transporting ATPase subunit F [Acetanaerobacterium elongatum]
MYKIGVLGDRDSIYGFAALGLTTVPVSDTIEAAKAFRRMAEGGYAVIYITEALAQALEHEIQRCKDAMLPAVIPIPGVSGNNGMGIRNVKKFVEQAVGSDIIFNDGK